MQQELESFPDEEISRRFYTDFRNGLVHEARIKNGGEFSLEQATTIFFEHSIMRVNPIYLHQEVYSALARFIELLAEDADIRKVFVSTLKQEFAYELAGIE